MERQFRIRTEDDSDNSENTGDMGFLRVAHWRVILVNRYAA